MHYPPRFLFRSLGTLVGLASIVFFLSAAANATPWSSPVSVSDLGRANNYVTQEQGAGETWLAVWESDAEEGGATGQELNIFFARSTDDGETWSLPAPLNSNVAQQDSFDMRPHIATDRRGNWICVWQSTGVAEDEMRIVYARSHDGGETWQDAEVLTQDIRTTGFGWEENPRIAFAGDTWVVVWEDGDGEITGNSRIFMTRSDDGGDSWEDARLISKDETGANITPTLAASGLDTFTVAWSSRRADNDDERRWEIQYSQSGDAGDTWGEPSAVMTLQEQEDAGESAEWNAREPQLAADGRGRWVLLWRADAPLGVDAPIRYSVSEDNGLTWNSQGVLADPGGENQRPALAADGSGNWVAVWSNLDPERPAANTLLMYALGASGGTAWTEPELVHPDAHDETVNEANPHVATDGLGQWLTAWSIDDMVRNAPLIASNARFTGTVEGTVVDLSEREPLEGAVALLYMDGDLPERAAPVDNDGVFQFFNVAAGPYTVEVRAPGYATATEDGNAAVGVTREHDFVRTAAEPERAMGGRITDEETGQPLPGVRVRRTDGEETLDVTYSCARGRYVLPLPDRLKQGEEAVELVYEARGYETITRHAEPLEEGEAEVDVELPPTFAPPDLYGTVTAEDSGEPIEDAEVELAGFGEVSVRTNSEGEYRLRNLPERTYTVRAQRIAYEAQTRTERIQGTRPRRLDFELASDDDPDYHPADVNRDGWVDAQDIQLVINDILGLEINPDYDTDVLGNDTVDARDLQYVINVVLGIAE